MIKTIPLWAGILFSVCTIGQTPATPAGKTTHPDAALNITPAGLYKEAYRPQLHFSPQEKWMNDPNGMVFYHGVYHLFFQYYPGDIVWGPMHWGHATSKDLIHWRQWPIALYPDSLGYIFSGSAVVDSNNTTGFGQSGRPPLVAIFTHHDPAGEKRGNTDYQNQSLAYSLDNGQTWTKYKNNPVLKNPGIVDFRDPKVMWYKPGKKWVMTLATKDCITFYSSPDLKSWTKDSEFGKNTGEHGGVWECPDLFPLQLDGVTYWVLIVNVNPGGPNGGSATQYFIGQFDGKIFYPLGNTTKWLDYGPDEYAGVTWGNTGARKIFLGWMSNWEYASLLPTRSWRNAMTLPRELSLQRSNGDVFLSSMPVKELNTLRSRTLVLKDWPVGKTFDLSAKLQVDTPVAQARLTLRAEQLADFSLIFSNAKGEQLAIGYDKTVNKYYIDRTLSGNVDFHKGFGAKYFSPRLTAAPNLDLTLVLDASSLELFADRGLTVMSCVFFPSAPFTKISVVTNEGLMVKELSYSSLRSIW